MPDSPKETPKWPQNCVDRLGFHCECPAELDLPCCHCGAVLELKSEDQEHCPESKDGHGHCVDWWEGGSCCWCRDTPDRALAPIPHVRCAPEVTE